MALVLAAIAIYAAWVGAAWALPRHWEVLCGPQRPPPTALLRTGALVLAILALGLCVARDGPAFGTLLWLCLACVGAWLSALTQAMLAAAARRSSRFKDPR
ncbi:DUF3325 family protein [Variovorax sp. LT2P21]|uniref:DUF3325 family protein n=1 Tax=Variovorax sp. LT2P21 TaxID=3443731 RepID=UPI003F451579